MSIRKSVFRGGLTLAIGQGISQVCTFVRSVVLARLISPADFGIAATFAMTFAFLDMISHFAADSLLIQAQDGSDEKFQKTAHAVHAYRGAINGLVLFLLAAPISRLFGVPQAKWAFQLLGLVPLLRGFRHLDTYRLQRDMRFGPTTAADVISNVVPTLLVVPIAWWYRDYSAMLYLLLIQSVVYVAATHYVAERKFQIGWDRYYARRIFTFGWPLLINGLLMYGVFQGDRFVIGAAHNLFAGNSYSLTDLGVYSVAFSLTMSVAMLMVNVTSSLFLPLLSRAQGIPEQFNRRYVGCANAIASLAVAMCVPFVVAGGTLVRVIYGPKYVRASEFVGWIAAMWGLRLLRVAPTLAAMAHGDTRNAMLSNIVRTVALGGVIAVAAVNGPLVWIAVCGFLGEVLALVVCVLRLQIEHKISAAICVKPFLTASAATAIAAVIIPSGLNAAVSIGAAVCLTLVALASMLVILPELRRDITSGMGSGVAPVVRH